MALRGGAAGAVTLKLYRWMILIFILQVICIAITAANNLLSAMIDNPIHQGNELQIDLRQLSWTRVLDMNDRALPVT